MRKITIIFSCPFLLMLLSFLTTTQIYGGSEPANITDKINLKILYLGHPNSNREKDYISFLKQHFIEVSKGDLAAFNEEQAEDYNVVIMDYDGRCFDTPKPELSERYTHPTVTIAGTGALIGSKLNLKTGYL